MKYRTVKSLIVLHKLVIVCYKRVSWINSATVARLSTNEHKKCVSNSSDHILKCSKSGESSSAPSAAKRSRTKSHGQNETSTGGVQSGSQSITDTSGEFCWTAMAHLPLESGAQVLPPTQN